VTRALPAEVVYRPYGTGPWRMGMDLVSVQERDWFEIDALYPSEMIERQRLLDDDHAAVFSALPASEAARDEALAMLRTALVTHHPDWFSLDGQIIRNHLTREAWHGGEHDPLEIAGRLVQEDLCIIQPEAAGPVFTAAVLCFPSRWKLLEKIGKPLVDVHGPVPFYKDRLARPVDRFFTNLKIGHIATRLNWSLLDDPTLFQPGGKWRTEGDSDITPENAADRIFLRVERQSLRRLPESGAVLFGIRVHVYPLRTVIASPEQAMVLAEAVRALPPDIQHYKSLWVFRSALLAWLDG
jgi:dimethylamine monooxygenase subunit A